MAQTVTAKQAQQTQELERSQQQSQRPQHLIRTLLGSLREYRKHSLLGPLFVVVEGILEILIPTLMALLID